MSAPLDEHDLDAEAREELCELAGDRPAAKHDERFRQALEREGIVAGDVTNLAKLLQGRRRDVRAGGDDEMCCGEFPGALVSSRRVLFMALGQAGRSRRSQDNSTVCGSTNFVGADL